MGSEQSVTAWIEQIQGGDPAVADRLWDRYFPDLLRAAGRKLGGVSLAGADEEDVALSAFHTVCRALAENKLPHVRDRDELWRTLVLIVAGKAVDQRRRHFSRKRGGGRAAADPDELAALAGREPDPVFVAQLAEELDRLLARLPDADLRQIALLRLVGYTSEEVAGLLGCSLRTVTRCLTLIRRTWEVGEPVGPERGDDPALRARRWPCRGRGRDREVFPRNVAGSGDRLRYVS